MKHLYQRKRKSQFAIYLILLFAAVSGMVLMRRCGSHNPYPRQSEGGSGADTLDVAIIYGPLSYFIYADTLGGLNYDLLRDLSVELDRAV